MKVLHLPSTVGGNPQGLSRHLRESGVDSETWTFQQNYFKYPCDRVLWSPEDGPLAREVKRLCAILEAARSADVIHFNFGTSLAWPQAPRPAPGEPILGRWLRRLVSLYRETLQLIELSLYRAGRIPMFVHYQGDDARQGDRSVALFRNSIAANVEPHYYDAFSDRLKRRMIRRMDRFCDAIYTVNPDLLHVLPPTSRFVPYCHIALDEWPPVYPDPESNAPIRIGHAPSHRGVKGTEVLIRAVEELQAEGLELELVLVEGLSNEEARKKYERIDVLVDQLYAGWYGGVAVEAMALGKPVLVYIRHEDLDGIPAAMRNDLPVVHIEARTLTDRLRDIVQMPRRELHRLGCRSRAFVERWHNPKFIAAAIKADYDRALASRGKKDGQACGRP